MGLFATNRIGSQPAEGARAAIGSDQSELAPAAGGALELRNVSKSFGGLQALRDVSLRVEPASIHALIGPNGAGKTTLINAVTGFCPVDAGQIVIDRLGAEIRSMDDAARRGIVRTFQTIKLFGDMTVLEHVVIGCARHSKASALGAIVAGPSGRQQEARNIATARELIGFVGLTRYEQAPANSLAYGHRRLLEIARAHAVRPKLLLLDEPAAGLVAEEIQILAGIIRQLKASGMTVLLIEHHMDLVTSISDRVTVLDYGVVIAEGPPSAIQRDKRVIAAYLGTPHGPA
jgi:ABC-type branched-subunit amino acid transport system ATPase component